MMNDQTTPPPPPRRVPRGRRRPTKPLSRKPIILLVAVGLLATGGVLVFDTLRDPQGAALKQDPGLDVLVVPEFAMTTQSGEQFTRADLLGHITVMDFFFTNCPAICPALSRSMKQIQDAVGDRGVRLVSVSVDPKNDTEATLLAHSNELGADPAVWTFLRADDFEQVRVLSEDGLKLGLSLDDSRPIKTRLGDDMPWIDHSGKLLLLDSEARVIGLYSGLDERDVAALIQRLARATTPK
jgi:protein SCO1/2